MISLIGFTLSAAAQKSNPSTYAKTITTTDLKRHLYKIASDEMEGRETATPGQKKAAAYIESEFRRIGLQPGNEGSYQMDYPVFQDSLIGSTLMVNEKKLQPGVDYKATGQGNSANLYFSEAVHIKNSVEALNLQSTELGGKLAVIEASWPLRTRGTVYGSLLKKGVAAIMVITDESSVKGTVNPLGNLNRTIYKDINPPVIMLITRTAFNRHLKVDSTQFSAFSVIKADIRVGLEKKLIERTSSNVVGVLPGTDLKDQYLFITAHYDHLGKRGNTIYYGADDDGSGTTAVIELAEAFAQAKAKGKGPRRTIVFMTVSGEEKGLWGSEYYSEHPIFPLDKTTADLNIDMIGRIDPSRKKGDSLNYVYVVGDDKLSTDLRSISEATNKKYTKLELDYKYNDPNDKEMIYYRSDHFNFAKMGVPIIFYFNGTHKDYHAPTDTPDKINYDLMAKRAQLVFYTAWDMANRNEMLKRDLKLQALSR